MQGQLSSCATRCGDGRRVLMFEECDDANTDSGDGCRGGRETANTARQDQIYSDMQRKARENVADFCFLVIFGVALEL